VKLDDLSPGAAVRGILPDASATVVSVQWHGGEALTLTYRDPKGRVAEEILYRHDEPRLSLVEAGRPWSCMARSHLLTRIIPEPKCLLNFQICLVREQTIRSVSLLKYSISSAMNHVG
jgi:hypothetical protein